MLYKVTAHKCEEFLIEADSEDEAIRECNPNFGVDWYDIEELESEDEEDE